MVVLIDLPVYGRPTYGRPTRLVWHKRRMDVPGGSTARMRQLDRGGQPHRRSARQLLTTRAARWATIQVGRCARSVNEVADELGLRLAHRERHRRRLRRGPARRLTTTASARSPPSGSTRCSMVRVGPFHRQHFSTQIVDVRAGQLLDIVPGRSSAEPMGWLAAARPGLPGRHPVRHSRSVRPLPPRLRGDGARRHPGGGSVPRHQAGQHQARRVPSAGPERDPRAPGTEVRSPLPVPASPHQGQGAPRRQGEREAAGASSGPGTRTGTWPPVGRRRRPSGSSTQHADPDIALEWVTQLGHDLQDADYPVEARSLGRTLIRWRLQIAAWHTTHVSNGPTEAVNNWSNGPSVVRSASPTSRPLPHPLTALRRQAQLEPVGYRHSPLKREEPLIAVAGSSTATTAVRSGTVTKADVRELSDYAFQACGDSG